MSEEMGGRVSRRARARDGVEVGGCAPSSTHALPVKIDKGRRPCSQGDRPRVLEPRVGSPVAGRGAGMVRVRGEVSPNKGHARTRCRWYGVPGVQKTSIPCPYTRVGAGGGRWKPVGRWEGEIGRAGDCMRDRARSSARVDVALVGGPKIDWGGYGRVLWAGLEGMEVVWVQKSGGQEEAGQDTLCPCNGPAQHL